MKDDKLKPNNKPLYLVIVGLLLLFISVSIIIHNYNYSSSKAGALGDAFNGLSAPFIAILSAFLIFYSFREQIAANRLQYQANKMLESQWMFDTYLKLFKEIESEFFEIEVLVWGMGEYEMEQTSHKGREAINAILNNPPAVVRRTNEALHELNIVLSELGFYVKTIKPLEIQQKQFLARKVYRFYYNQLSGVQIALQEKFTGGKAPQQLETVNSLFEKLDKQLLDLNQGYDGT